MAIEAPVRRGVRAKSSERIRTRLRQLAKLCGVHTTYVDVFGERKPASDEALFLVLKSLGVPMNDVRDSSDVLRETQIALWKQPVSPVTVSWEGKPATLRLRIRTDEVSRKLSAHLRLENGEERRIEVVPKDLPDSERVEVDGSTYLLKEWTLQGELPQGYHRLILEEGIDLPESLVISAPLKAYAGDSDERIWGVFVPIYALHSKRSWGAGDFSDLEALQDWLSRKGGRVIATLPFMAAFLDEFFEPGPYSPASRLFWNEFYLNLHRALEDYPCPQGRKAAQSIESGAIVGLRSSPLVDYREGMALKRKVLEAMTLCFFGESPERRQAFEAFKSACPAVEDYAAFRAVGEKLKKPWPQWPHPLRDGRLSPGDYEEDARRYHLFVQWLAHEQLKDMNEKARRSGPGLYIDLPLGVNPNSYDTWRMRGLFPRNVSAGAPPDAVFTSGQDWGFAPLHPAAIREDRYAYVIDYLSHIMQNAGILRLDHVMGLHRIFWIPKQLDASHGVYVRYASEEFYAILNLESHRNKCMLVGENLGTVPGYVNEAMGRHNVQKMYVVQYELEGRSEKVLKPAPVNSVASLNTHDMVPFAGYLHEQDIRDRSEVGLLDEKAVRREKKNRASIKKDLTRFLRDKKLLDGPESDEVILKGSLAYLSSSPARFVLVTLEDLWLEEQAQNFPGTSTERPNWRRKLRYSLEQMEERTEIDQILRRVDERRRKRSHRR